MYFLRCLSCKVYTYKKLKKTVYYYYYQFLNEHAIFNFHTFEMFICNTASFSIFCSDHNLDLLLEGCD